MLFKVFNRRCSRECFNVRAWQQKGSWSCSLQWSSFNLWLIPDTQNMSFFNAVITFCCPVTPFPSLFLSAHLPAKNFSGSNNRPVSLWEYRNVGGRPPGCDRGGSGNPIQSKQTIKKKKTNTEKNPQTNKSTGLNDNSRGSWRQNKQWQQKAGLEICFLMRMFFCFLWSGRTHTVTYAALLLWFSSVCEGERESAVTNTFLAFLHHHAFKEFHVHCLNLYTNNTDINSVCFERFLHV